MKKLLTMVIVTMLGLSAMAESMEQHSTAIKQQIVEEPVVNGNLAFMGISLGETPANMVTKLKAKGFRLVSKDAYAGNYEMSGLYYGVKSRLIVTNDFNGEISNIAIYNTIEFSKTRGNARLKDLVEKISKIYGQGKYTTPMTYRIEIEQGVVCIEMFDSDELEGSSGTYLVATSFEKQSRTSVNRNMVDTALDEYEIIVKKIEKASKEGDQAASMSVLGEIHEWAEKYKDLDESDFTEDQKKRLDELIRRASSR